jgi:hypothetical protein
MICRNNVHQVILLRLSKLSLSAGPIRLLTHEKSTIPYDQDTPPPTFAYDVWEAR